MERHIKYIEFDKIRFAYKTVKSFLENESLKKVESLKTTVVKDLRLVGDDNYELLEKFVTKFELDHKNFIYEKHFLSEGELFGSDTVLQNLLTLSVWLPLKTIELLTFNKIVINKPDIDEQKRVVDDMTFKDMLTWYIEKKYATANEIKYKIKKRHTTQAKTNSLR